jgi:SET domain-containing protein
MAKAAGRVPLHTARLEVRASSVHGKGAFATGPIVKGMRLIEYVGERVSHKEADRRYESKDANDNHTFLFIVNSRTVIDAGVDGNDARFFNHSCDPNCESVIEDGRVYIEAIRAVQPGEELTYDYQIQREAEDPPDIDEIFACRCGAVQCRGTMLWPTKRPARQARRNKARRNKATRKKATRKKAATRKGAARKKKRTANKGGRRR